MSVSRAPPAAAPVQPAAASAPGVGGRADRRLYLWLLTWAFTLFGAMRIVSYLPTLWAIHLSGDSSQHSAWAWFIWAGANLTMAAWLYEHNERRCNRAVGVNVCNATMCLATLLLVLFYRL